MPHTSHRRKSRRSSGRNQRNRTSVLPRAMTTGGGPTPFSDSQNSRIYTIRQTLPQALISANNGTEADYSGASTTSLAPYLALLDGVSSLQGVWDQYRFDYVETTFRPMFLAAAWSISADTPSQIYTCVDYDDATSTAISALRQYQNVTTHTFETFTVRYKPHIAIAAYGAGAFTQYSNQVGVWLDSGSYNTQHYGLKVGISAGSSVNLQRWYVDTTVTVSFRNVR